MSRQNVYEIGTPTTPTSKAPLSSALNISGYKSSVDRTEVIRDIKEVINEGYVVETPINNTVTEIIDLESVLQVIDCCVAWAVNNYPENFTDGISKDNIFMYPMQLKAYLVVLFLNRVRQVNSLNTSTASGVIPYIADEAPVPKPIFEMLCAMAPYKEGTQYGVLTLDYDFEFEITDLQIQSQLWTKENLSSPALLSARGLPSNQVGIFSLLKDSTLKELVIVESTPIPATPLNDFWAQQNEDQIFFLTKQMWPSSSRYDELPLTSVSADFFACSRESTSGSGRPSNQLMNPFSNYDPYHASVFCFFKRCEIRATMNQKPTFQSPTRPNEFTSAAQYMQEYIVGCFVLAGSRLNDSVDRTYLGSRKYYSFMGKPYNPSITFKLVTPAVLKTQITSLVAAFQAAMKAGVANLEDLAPNNSVPKYDLTSIRFYREATMAMLACILRRVQDYTLSFMRKAATIAFLRTAELSDVSGALKVMISNIGPVLHGQNLVLPFYEFSALDLDNLEEVFFHMNLDVESPLTSQNLFSNNLYVDVVENPAPLPNTDRDQIHWEDQIMNAAWVAAYTLLSGRRNVPGTIVSCRTAYELVLQAYSPGGGVWSQQPDRKVGGMPMLTYTKGSIDSENTKVLPAFDNEGTPGTQMKIQTMKISVQSLLFCEFSYGQPLTIALIGFHSLDIDTANPDDLQEYPYEMLVIEDPSSLLPYDKLNVQMANSNGVIQKSLAAFNAREHDMKTSKKLLGVPLIHKVDQDLCFFNAIFNTLETIGSSFMKGVEVVADTGNVVKGVAVGVESLVDGIFSSRDLYQGSPSETKPHPVSSVHRKQSQRPVVTPMRNLSIKGNKTTPVRPSSLKASKPVPKSKPSAQKKAKAPANKVKTDALLKRPKKRQPSKTLPPVSVIVNNTTTSIPRPSAQGVKRPAPSKVKYVPPVIKTKSVPASRTPDFQSLTSTSRPMLGRGMDRM